MKEKTGIYFDKNAVDAIYHNCTHFRGAVQSLPDTIKSIEYDEPRTMGGRTTIGKQLEYMVEKIQRIEGYIKDCRDGQKLNEV